MKVQHHGRLLHGVYKLALQGLHAGIGSHGDLEASHGAISPGAGADCAPPGGEIWERWGREYSVHQQDWPEFAEELTHEETFTLVVQVNGKVRDTIEASVSLDEDGARELALASERVQQFMAGRT